MASAALAAPPGLGEGHTAPNASPLTSRPLARAGARAAAVGSWIAFSALAAIRTFWAPAGPAEAASIWAINRRHPTPFSVEPVITSLYWSLLLLAQIPFLVAAFTPSDAAALAPHFAVTTALNIALVHTWTHDRLWWALAVAVLNFLHLSALYLSAPPLRPSRRSGPPLPNAIGSPPALPLIHHYAVLAGPYAFSFVSLYWVGAAALDIHSLVGRVLANVAIWGILAFGAFALVVFGDWMLAWCLCLLTTSLGVAQFFIHTIALQWIFAFTIMACLFAGTVIVALPALLPQPWVDTDGERAPLLTGRD